MANANSISFLNRLVWVNYKIDSKPKDVNRPGVVLVCCPELPTNAGEDRFTPLDVFDAKNDAAAVAEGLLKQKWRCHGQVYARIHLSDIQSLRAEAAAALAEICTQHKE